MHRAPIDEPEAVYPEEAFEASVLALLEAGMSGLRQRVFIVQHFGLDIAIFIGDTESSAKTLFIEVKSYSAQRMGGVGFGDGKGRGPQVEILLAGPGGPADGNVRWAFVDATRGFGTARYALVDCDAARIASMGGVAHGKQNNFRMSALSPYLVGWREFCKQLVDFVGVR